MHDLDHTQRFLFDDNDVRGEMVSLAESYQHVLAKHPYPQPVAQLLGEMLAAAALLVGTLKFEGLLILQARVAAGWIDASELPQPEPEEYEEEGDYAEGEYDPDQVFGDAPAEDDTAEGEESDAEPSNA